jgi:hypothetical protein
MAIAPIAKQLDEVLEKLAAINDNEGDDKVVQLRLVVDGIQAGEDVQSPAV